MPKKSTPADAPTALRGRAERRLRDQRPGQKTEDSGPKAEADNQRQLHELEVHQIELEMQNEELEAARSKLEALLEKYTDLYDFAPVGYLTLDRAGDIREANLAGASLLGIARSALVNRRFGLLVALADRPAFAAFLEQVFARGAQAQCEVQLQADGQPPVEVRLRANIFEAETTCRVAVTDITEFKRAEADRLILNKLESTGILAGGIAHDFNNLFTIILLNLELAQGLNLPDAKLAGYLAEARDTSLLARGLTAQLVTFAQGGTPVRRPTFLSGVIQESIRPALSGSNVRCEFSLAEDLWGAEVDAGQIGQVLRNLALNAREAMPRGGVIFVRAENVILSEEDQPPLPAGEYVRLSLADQGDGITKVVLPKIFDPYFSTKERGTQKGMGLGLTICHSIIQKHDGALVVKSEVGVGTTFHLYLPAARTLRSNQPTGGRTGGARPGRVLVMDDEEGVRRVLGLTLWGLGHQVELAEDGQQAVELYLDAQRLGHPFDVLLLDLTVRGGMGGQATVDALRARDPGVRAIAMSGYANDPVILEPERHGFEGALAKPFDTGKLSELLSRILGPRPVAPTP
ncbi:MAG: ATP-binding protein [Verrucomicrobiota bacterium]